MYDLTSRRIGGATKQKEICLRGLITVFVCDMSSVAISAIHIANRYCYIQEETNQRRDMCLPSDSLSLTSVVGEQAIACIVGSE